jgi:hypothetical protein
MQDQPLSEQKSRKELHMRLAILSDIHGNPHALDAVLADIQSQGEVDAYWVPGDFAALGYDPVTPLEKVTALSPASFTRGNTDRYVVTQDLPLQPEQALQDPLCCQRSSRRYEASPGPGAISVLRAGWTGSRTCRWKCV